MMAIRSTLWSLVLGCVLTLAGSYPANAVEQIIWIGQPSFHEFVAANMQVALQNYMEAGAHLADMQAELSRARADYFKASSTAARQAAGNELGRRLFEKDLLIAAGKLMCQDKIYDALLGLINGQAPYDGGIPPVAVDKYSAWVNTVSFKMGGCFGGAPNVSAMQAAILASEAEYTAYRRLRDQAEIDEWLATTQNKPRPLLRTRTLSAFQYIGETPFNERYNKAIKNIHEQILVCVYASRTSTDHKYWFWKDSAPETVAALIAVSPKDFAMVRDHALPACPAEEGVASRAAAEPQKAVLTKEIQDKFLGQQRDPKQDEQARQSREQNAAQAQERQQEQQRRADEVSDRRARARECSETYRSELAAAGHSPTAVRRALVDAARQKYTECAREAHGQ